jgi:hypothetical protein
VIRVTRNTRGSSGPAAATRYQMPALFTRPSGPTVRGAAAVPSPCLQQEHQRDQAVGAHGYEPKRVLLTTDVSNTPLPSAS